MPSYATHWPRMTGAWTNHGFMPNSSGLPEMSLRVRGTPSGLSSRIALIVFLEHRLTWAPILKIIKEHKWSIHKTSDSVPIPQLT